MPIDGKTSARFHSYTNNTSEEELEDTKKRHWAFFLLNWFFFFFSKRTTTKALATHLRRCQNEGGQGTFSLMYVQSLDERFFIWYRIDLISASYFSSVPHSHQTDYLSSSSNMLVIMSVFGADPESSSFSLRFKLKHIKSRMRYDAKWSLLNR